MFRNPIVYPCRDNITQTARGLAAGFRGKPGLAEEHYAAGRKAQQEARERGTNKKPKKHNGES